jgi:hypothetical protein
MQRFDLRKLNDAEVKEQYQVKITNRFAALENCDDNVDRLLGFAPCSMVEVYRRFKGACCLHHQDG